MGLILAIDTSAQRGSVALGNWQPEAENVSVEFAESFATGRGQGAGLFRALDSARKLIGRRELESIIVGLGPGSYSGIRVAIAAACGLSMATRAQLGGRASATCYSVNDESYFVVGDARREMFYLTAVQNRKCVRGPELLSRLEVESRLAAETSWPVLTSDSGLEFSGSIEALPDAGAWFDRRFYPLQAQEYAKAGTLEPIYLRPPSITTGQKNPT